MAEHPIVHRIVIQVEKPGSRVTFNTQVEGTMQVWAMVSKGRKHIKKEQPTELNPAERSRKMVG